MTKANWKDIHKDFSKRAFLFGKTCQQEWKQANITKKEAKKWIATGFKPYDLDKVKQWKNLNFSPAETKAWLEVGLRKYEGESASWLRTNSYTPELVKNNLEQLRNGCENLKANNSQAWLEQVYPHNVKEINISWKNLKGELNLSQYQQLERLYCSRNELTNITLPTSLKVLDLSGNNFNQDLTFLVPCTNLERLDLGNWNLPKEKIEQGICNKFTGSLDYLSGMEKLKSLNISYTDINEVNIDKLPRSLENISYSTEKFSQLDKVKYAFCQKCYKPNTSEKWCQPCAEQEWKQSIEKKPNFFSWLGEKYFGKPPKLINKFIKQQSKCSGGKLRLSWIPYEEFTNIKHLAEGGFSKIYEAFWYDEGDCVVLKILKDSQNITLEFLTEIANTKLVDDGWIVKCHGISQDPITKNYLMVMQYMEDGNLRQVLQNKNSKLSLWDKLEKLRDIVNGLYNIHNQNLIHQDFHSGNILNNWRSSFITDLGLSRPVNYLKEEGKIFGVLPYVAPEVLRGQPYTKASDIYSFGIIAYELLTQAYPYADLVQDEFLAVRVCQGLRPNLDKVPIPKLLKDLVKKCWDGNPEKRPEAGELLEIINNWTEEIRNEINPFDREYLENNTPFYQQYQAIKKEYNTFSKDTPYQIHPNATLTSKMIDTKKITQLLEISSLDDLRIDISKKLNISEDNNEAANREFSRENEVYYNVESEEIVPIEIQFQPTDYNFCAWLRDTKQLTPEEVLNQEWQEQQQSQIEIPPK